MAANFYLLVYDIPQRSGIPNPSNYLRRFAVRINLSCWILHGSDIPYMYLRQIEADGAKWRIVGFDAGENESITRMAIEAIQSEINGMRNRTARVCERAANEAEQDRTNAGTLPAYRKRVATQLKKMRKGLNDLKSAASRFGVNVDAIGSAEGYLRSLHSVCLQRAKALADAVNELNRLGADTSGSTARGVRNVIRTDRVTDTTPVLAAADFLEDTATSETGREAANRLRVLFADRDSWF